MDIKTFEEFLASQQAGFQIFLRGCQDIDRQHMRIALKTHVSKMTFALTTAHPLHESDRVFSSPFGSAKSQHAAASARRSVTSPFKTPISAASFIRDDSPSYSSPSFKTPAPLPVSPRLGSAIKASTTPVKTPMSKRIAGHDSASKRSVGGRVRTPSTGHRTGIFRGGAIGGAGNIFKSLPATPKGKDNAESDDSSAGSPLPSDESPTVKRSSHMRSAKSTKRSNVTSPFEVAARRAESKNYDYESASASDFEIPLHKHSIVGIRRVSSRIGQIADVIPKKGLGDGMDIDPDATESDGLQTPSKKQKTGQDANNDEGMETEPIEID